MSRAAVPSAHPSSFVTIDGGRRALIDLPAPESEQLAARTAAPVLLVPGFTGSKEDFTPILDGVAAAGHRVLALDLAGQYESAGPDDPAAYRPEVLGPELARVLDALALDTAHLVGHSYGGLVARAAVLADPSRWASLTLLCSGPAALSGSRRGGTELLQQAAMGMELEPLYDGLLDYWTSHGEAVPPPEGAQFQRDRFTGGPAAALIGMATGLLDEPDRVDELRAAAAGAGLPVAVVFGADDDAWSPAEQSEMAGRLGVRPVVIQGAGHSPAYEQTSETVLALTAFWAGAASAPTG